MKLKLFLFIATIGLTITLNAQTSKVTAAWNYMNDYDNELKPIYLEKALENIEFTVNSHFYSNIQDTVEEELEYEYGSET